MLVIDELIHVDRAQPEKLTTINQYEAWRGQTRPSSTFER
jgi:hypothetical protein